MNLVRPEKFVPRPRLDCLKSGADLKCVTPYRIVTIRWFHFDVFWIHYLLTEATTGSPIKINYGKPTLLASS